MASLLDNMKRAIAGAPMSDSSIKPVIFISYSRKDRRWLEFVQGHLGPAMSHGHFESWDDSRIEGGADWRAEIDRALATCRVFVLLVSNSSLSSRFILDEEVE